MTTGNLTTDHLTTDHRISGFRETRGIEAENSMGKAGMLLSPRAVNLYLLLNRRAAVCTKSRLIFLIPPYSTISRNDWVTIVIMAGMLLHWEVTEGQG